MTQRSIGWTVLPALVLAIAVSAAASANGRQAGDSDVTDHLYASDSSREAPGETQKRGRYKRQGDNCEWDVNGSGPNQCTPQTKGRFKKAGDNCAWDVNDNGPDQCKPKKGRFKKEGDMCVWNANDSGPQQCNPRQPR